MNPWEMTDEQLSQAMGNVPEQVNVAPWEMPDEQLIQAAQQEPQGKRGDNLAGFGRNLLQGLAFGFGDELEAALRSGRISGAEYEKYLQNARESQKGYLKEHPVAGTTAQIGGALLPTVATLGASAPASGAGLGSLALRGAATGAELGALSGFGSAEGGLGERLSGAGWGAATGGALGWGVPVGVTGAKATTLATRRILGGLKKPLTEAQYANAILENAIKPGTQQARNAAILSSAAARGDKALADAASNLSEKLSLMNQMRVPQLAEKLPNAPWTKATPSVNTILKKIETPAMKQAKTIYSAFDTATPTNTPGAGLAINNLMKEEPAFAKLMRQELSVNAPDWAGTSLTSREGLKKMSQVLNARIPKGNLTPEQATKNAALLRGINKLDDLTETLYPGSRAVDQIYATAAKNQEIANKVATDRIKQIAQVPFEQTPEVSATGVARLGFAPYVRGKARELALTGAVESAAPSRALNVSTQAATNAIIRTLLEQGKARPSVDVQFGDEPVTDDPNAWYNQPYQY